MGIDLQNGYAELLRHQGHAVVIATYGDYDNPANMAIECEDCSEVLIDFDQPTGKRITFTDPIRLYDRARPTRLGWGQPRRGDLSTYDVQWDDGEKEFRDENSLGAVR